MPITSLIVANLATTSAYAASFVVEVYSDSGLTTLVGSDSCAAVTGSGGGFVQATALVVHGLTYGTTYYARAGVVAPVTGVVAWSATHSFDAGTSTVPSGVTYTHTLTATASGISVIVTPSSVPTDLDHYEAVWVLDGSTPVATVAPAWSGNVDGAGNITFFAGAHPGETVTIYIRSVNTANQQQTWVSLGSATVLTSTSGITGEVGVRLIAATDVNKPITQPMAYDGTITAGLMFADVSGSAQITVSKSNASSYPTFTSIVASAPATLVSQQKNTSVPLTGWTLSFNKGDILEFNLDSASTIAWVYLNLQTIRS